MWDFLSCPNLVLVGFDLTWAPCLVEPGLFRAVEAQDGEPALAGAGLNPVGCALRWPLRPDGEQHAAIRVGPQVFAHAVDARELLVGGLQHGSCLRVVNDERPEVLRRHVSRDPQGVGLDPRRTTHRWRRAR